MEHRFKLHFDLIDAICAYWSEQARGLGGERIDLSRLHDSAFDLVAEIAAKAPQKSLYQLAAERYNDEPPRRVRYEDMVIVP
jgi:hypothetical protein